MANAPLPESQSLRPNQMYTIEDVAMVARRQTPTHKSRPSPVYSYNQSP